MNNSLRILTIASIFALLIFKPTLNAEPQVRLGLDHLHLYWFGIVPSGAAGYLEIYDLEIFEGSKAQIRFVLGTGLYSETHYRNKDGRSYAVPSLYNSQLNYSGDRFNIAYGTSISNDFPVFENFFLSPFLMFRGYSGYRLRDDPFIPALWFDGQEWQFRHDFILGLQLSNLQVTEDIFNLKRGFWGELSLGAAIESTPRVSLDIRLYEEILSNDWVVFEYRGRILADALFDGARFDDLSFFGGSRIKWGLGGSLRGFEYSSYSAPYKAVLNNELRLIFAPFKEVAINPGVFIYTDTGIYFGEQDNSGGLLSFGIGASLDFFNFLVGNIRLDIPVIGGRLDGAQVKFSYSFDHF